MDPPYRGKWYRTRENSGKNEIHSDFRLSESLVTPLLNPGSKGSYTTEVFSRRILQDTKNEHPIRFKLISRICKLTHMVILDLKTSVF